MAVGMVPVPCLPCRVTCLLVLLLPFLLSWKASHHWEKQVFFLTGPKGFAHLSSAPTL